MELGLLTRLQYVNLGYNGVGNNLTGERGVIWCYLALFGVVLVFFGVLWFSLVLFWCSLVFVCLFVCVCFLCIAAVLWAAD